MYKFTGALILGAALMLPTVALPQTPERYYDKDHKDYHQWNAAEDRAWHRYWEERHHAAVEWQKANEAQRRAYWKWRHDHPDVPERH